jgi:hypothetical protein
MVLSSKLRPHFLVWRRGQTLCWRSSYSRYHRFESWPRRSVVFKKCFVVSCGPTGKYHVVFYNTWSLLLSAAWRTPCFAGRPANYVIRNHAVEEPEDVSPVPATLPPRKHYHNLCSYYSYQYYTSTSRSSKLTLSLIFSILVLYVFPVATILLFRWRGESLCL